MNGSELQLPGQPHRPSKVRYGTGGRLGVSPNWAELQERRKARLLKELLDEEVHLLPTDGAGRSFVNGFPYEKHEQLLDMLIDELSYARWPPVHEQRRSSYGCIVLPDGAWRVTHPVDAEVGEFLELSGKDPASRELLSARAYANGRTTFLVRSSQGPEGLLTLPTAGDELTVVRLVQALGTFVVQRTPAGAIKMFVQHHLYIFENDLWSVKAYADNRRLKKYVGQDSKALLSSLLAFCLHSLSARHIGATLVWCLEGDCESLYPKLETSGLPSAARIRLDQPEHLEAFATLLACIDGACLLAVDGTVVRIGVKLGASTQAKRLNVDRGEGMRHTSAKRFSFDQPQTLVFVVSQDGPVSVYHKGQRLELLTSTATVPSQFHLVCPSCGSSGWVHIATNYLLVPSMCPKCNQARRLCPDCSPTLGGTSLPIKDERWLNLDSAE